MIFMLILPFLLFLALLMLVLSYVHLGNDINFGLVIDSVKAPSHWINGRTSGPLVEP